MKSRSAGLSMSGGVRSTTANRAAHIAAPHASVAVQVTFALADAPQSGCNRSKSSSTSRPEHSCITSTLSSQASSSAWLPVPSHSTVVEGGQHSVGPRVVDPVESRSTSSMPLRSCDCAAVRNEGSNDCVAQPVIHRQAMLHSTCLADMVDASLSAKSDALD